MAENVRHIASQSMEYPGNARHFSASRRHLLEGLVVDAA